MCGCVINYKFFHCFYSNYFLTTKLHSMLRFCFSLLYNFADVFEFKQINIRSFSCEVVRLIIFLNFRKRNSSTPGQRMGNLNFNVSTISEVTPIVSLDNQDWSFLILKNTNGLRVDAFFVRMMELKVGLCTYFSIQSVVFNMLLLVFLLSHKDFRSWAFYPVTMQCFVDICGPGVANVIYEWKLMSKHYAEAKMLADAYPRVFPYVRMEEFESFHRIDGLLACVLLELRTFLNEYSTGLCLTATALVRYLSVCHPTLKLTSKHHKILAAGLITITLISLTLGFLEVHYNNFYSTSTETGIPSQNVLKVGTLVCFPN